MELMQEQASPVTAATVDLPDGRSLGYADYGDPDGMPIIYFHGGNSSRLEAEWFHEAAAGRGVRLIAPDRPGFGLSAPQPGRRLLDWPADVAHLADHLGVERFALLGLSGGGPHAAVVARHALERVSAAAIVSSIAPPEMPNKLRGMFFPLRINYWSARHAPAISRLFLRLMSGSYADADKFLQMIERLPAPDAELARTRPELIRQFSRAAVESHRHGIEGDAAEWQIYVHPWGFDLKAIRAPVYLWYGSVDSFVPLQMGRYLHSHICGSELRVVSDGGHFSTINNHIEGIFDDLLGMQPGQQPTPAGEASHPHEASPQ